MRLLNKGLRINKTNLLIFLFVLPQLKPISLDYILPTLDLFFNVGRIISFIAIVLLYLKKKKKPSPIVYSIALLQMWVTITTYLNSGDTHRAVFSMIYTIVIVLVVDFFPMKSVLPALMANFEWLLYVNLATLVIFPQGLYRQGVHNEFIEYFLGYKNSFFSYCLVATLLAGLNYLIRKKIIRSVLLITVSLLNVILAWSASSMLALIISVIMFLLLIVLQKPKVLTKIKLSHIIIVAIVSDILISVLNIVENSDFLSHIVQNVMKKQATFTGRIVIWGMATKMIAAKPFIGYGIGEHITWAGYDWYGHNQYYEMLLEGGIPCILLFLIIIVLINKKMSECSNRLIYNVFIVAFTGLFVFFIAEAGTGIVFYIIYVLAYHAESISDLCRHNNCVSMRSIHDSVSCM